MIAYLSGKIINRDAGGIILDVNGVGYEISLPLSVWEKLDFSDNVKLFIHQLVREDGIFLYGFNTLEERRLFRELLRVSGIGPKSALLIMSGMSGAEFLQTIRNADISALTRVPGIGKKTAERLIVELKDRFSVKSSAIKFSDNEITTDTLSQAQNEAIEALIALELKPQEAADLVSKAIKNNPDLENVETTALIKAALSLKLKK